MKYCPNCGYSPIQDDEARCPCCGEDVSEQVPYDYPEEEINAVASTDAHEKGTKRRTKWKDRPLKVRLALVVSGALIIVGACIVVLCLF